MSSVTLPLTTLPSASVILSTLFSNDVTVPALSPPGVGSLFVVAGAPGAVVVVVVLCAANLIVRLL